LRHEHWTKDELTLALDLFVRIGGKPDETDADVRALSDVLRARGTALDAAFRSAEAVSMKIRGFIQFAANETAKGLVNAGERASQVWDEFRADPARLRAAAGAILASPTWEKAVAVAATGAAPTVEPVEPVSGLRVEHFTRGTGRVAFARVGFPSVVVVFPNGERLKAGRETFVRIETGAIYTLAE